MKEEAVQLAALHKKRLANELNYSYGDQSWNVIFSPITLMQNNVENNIAQEKFTESSQI